MYTDNANKASVIICGAWWLIGGFVAFRPNGRGFESRSSRHVGTLSKFLVHNLFITIASAPPRRESALLSLAYIRTKGDIKDQLYCIVKMITGVAEKIRDSQITVIDDNIPVVIIVVNSV